MDEDDFPENEWIVESRSLRHRMAEQAQVRAMREHLLSGSVSSSKIVAPFNSEVVRMSNVDTAKARLVAALTEYAGLQALMDRFQGAQPPVGTVLRWVKKYDNRSGELVLQARERDELRFAVSAPGEYVYLAFRAPDGHWYTTSTRGANRRDWDQLLADIGDNPCEIASDWTEVPAPEKVDADAIDPVAWARQTFGKKDESGEK